MPGFSSYFGLMPDRGFSIVSRPAWEPRYADEEQDSYNPTALLFDAFYFDSSTSGNRRIMREGKYKPMLNYPQMLRPPGPPKFRPSELAAVARFRSLRDRIRNGPLYTVLDENARVSKKRKSAPTTTVAKIASFDPFTGMPTYTDRYVRKPRKLPNLHTRPYG